MPNMPRTRTQQDMDVHRTQKTTEAVRQKDEESRTMTSKDQQQTGDTKMKEEKLEWSTDIGKNLTRWLEQTHPKVWEEWCKHFTNVVKDGVPIKQDSFGDNDENN